MLILQKQSLSGKTAFLLLLATGWRISEVHACVRDEQYSSFNERGSLLIKPHSSFLAKNGLRKRIEQREIRTLIGSNGQVSKICPVAAMKHYLSKTYKYKTGCLFINLKKWQSSNTITTQISDMLSDN